MDSAPNTVFRTVIDHASGKRRFERSMSTVVERRMLFSANYFSPAYLRHAFFREHGVEVSLQSLHSAMKTLVKQGRIVKLHRGVYAHKRHVQR